MKINSNSTVVVFFVCLISCQVFPGIASAGEGEVIPLASSQGGWEIIPNFSDEFGGTAVDESKWQTATEPWSSWDWDSRNVTESGGQLHLTMRYDIRAKAGVYSSGLVRSKEAILYGYFEARIRAASRVPGTSSAFWAAPDKKERGAHTEIDFVETTQHLRDLRQLDTNSHVFNLPGSIGQFPLHNKMSWMAPWNPWQQFHVYGCEWDEKTIRWYVDGKEVGRQANPYWHQSLNVTLSLGLRQPLRLVPSMIGFPTSMDVDYVRVWRHKPSINNVH